MFIFYAAHRSEYQFFENYFLENKLLIFKSKCIAFLYVFTCSIYYTIYTFNYDGLIRQRNVLFFTYHQTMKNYNCQYPLGLRKWKRFLQNWKENISGNILRHYFPNFLIMFPTYIKCLYNFKGKGVPNTFIHSHISSCYYFI